MPESDAELDELVARTSGPQPGRRILHATLGGVLAAVVAYAQLTRAELTALFAAGFLASLGIDLVRLNVPKANLLFFRLLRWFASPREEGQIASSTWYLLGALVVVAAFDARTAISSILVLAFADPAASYLGRRWGTRPLGKGSMLGAGVFAVVAVCVLGTMHPWPVAGAVGVVVALVECQRLGVDDNITVPIATAVALTAAAALMP